MKGLGAKLVRYATVSVIATAVSLTVLGVLVGRRVVSAGWANAIATAVGTVPSLELNRRWVWHANGRRSMPAEVSEAAAWASASGLGTGARTLVAEAA